MSQVCNQCSRVNPEDAAYCYFDGALLAGHAGAQKQNPGAQPFPNQFVFPAGQICRNFDQLAMTSQQEWQAAIDMLKKGIFGNFFGGLGRADLAQAAQEASAFSDDDRALDHILSKLPTDVLEAPKVQVEPTKINLGQMEIGTDRTLELHLSNMGMRLLYGSVVSDCKWITLGDAPGNPQRLFQFREETTIPVQIRGQHLRAGSKPLEGNLIVDCNGGVVEIPVRVSVPVKSFEKGVLQGAVSPREIAQKARDKPKAAAALFQDGSVAKWFESNGWTYPVQGPNAAGLGAVQQFFEALGLAKAPKLKIKPGQIQLQGQVGQALETSLEVSSDEKRPVYAYAKCDVPWLDVSKFKLNGRFATISVSVPHVPDRSGESLQANITVIGNGNQQFKVGLSLAVAAANPFAGIGEAPTISLSPGTIPPPPPPRTPFPPSPAPAGSIPPPPSVPPPPAPPSYSPDAPTIPPTPAPPPPASSVTAQRPAPNPMQTTAPDMTRPGEPPFPTPGGAPAQGADPSSFDFSAPGGSVVAPPPAAAAKPKGPQSNKQLLQHIIPLGVLGLALIAVLIRDLVHQVTPQTSPIDARIAVTFDEQMRFGVAKLNPNKGKGDPDEFDIRLTFDPNGRSNDMQFRIDDEPFQFGKIPGGRWEKQSALLGPKKLGGRESVFVFTKGFIQVTQKVDIIEGEELEVSPGEYRQLHDTCRVRYSIKNDDANPHNVGARFMLDTYINNNDGVPFIIPGNAELIDKADYQDANIPSFIQAVEKSDLKDPGLIVQLNLTSSKYETPNRVSLTNYKVGAPYVVDVRPIGIDSAIVMYWPDKRMKPGEERTIGFTYGLGSVASESSKLGLVVPNRSFALDEEIEVVALVVDPVKDQTVRLNFPEGKFKIVEGRQTQRVPVTRPPTPKKQPPQGKKGKQKGKADPEPAPSVRSQVTWRIRALAEGVFRLEVESSRGEKASRAVRVRVKSVF